MTLSIDLLLDDPGEASQTLIQFDLWLIDCSSIIMYHQVREFICQ